MQVLPDIMCACDTCSNSSMNGIACEASMSSSLWCRHIFAWECP